MTIEKDQTNNTEVTNTQISQSNYFNEKKKRVNTRDNLNQKDVIYSMMNEFGGLIRNKQYSKKVCNKIRSQIKILRVLGVLPFCSKHYYNIRPVLTKI